MLFNGIQILSYRKKQLQQTRHYFVRAIMIFRQCADTNKLYWPKSYKKSEYGKNGDCVPGADAKDIQTLIEFAVFGITPPVAAAFKSEAHICFSIDWQCGFNTFGGAFWMDWHASRFPSADKDIASFVSPHHQ